MHIDFKNPAVGARLKNSNCFLPFDEGGETIGLPLSCRLQEPVFPQQLPGIHPWNEGADPQHPVSPIPGSLPSCLAPERLEGLDNSLVSSGLPHFWQHISSLPPYTIFSKTLPQYVQRNSNMGIMIPPRVMSF
jgi:hypothetical protein